jgi:hypothetical protein
VAAKEQLENVVQALNRRISDPLLGTYILLFLTLNYEIPVHLFSSDPVNIKIANINGILSKLHLLNFGFFSWNYSHTFISPLALAIIYCFAYPILFNKLYPVIEGHRITSENIKIKSQENLVTLEKTISSMQNAIDSLKIEAQQLRDQISNKDTLLASVQKDFETLNEKKNSLEIELAKLKEKPDDRLSIPDFISKLLQKLNLDQDFFLKPRDYKNARGLSAEQTVQFFNETLYSLAQYLEIELDNSAKAKRYLSEFRKYILLKSYHQSLALLTETLAVPSLTSEEKKLIEFMQLKVSQVDTFSK